MLCVNCGVDIRGSKVLGFPKSCPACGHKTVTRPKLSGFADRQIKMAFDRVSAEGTVHFLREHVVWELSRIVTKRVSTRRVAFRLIIFVVLIGLGVGLLAVDYVLLGLLAMLIAFGLFILVSVADMGRDNRAALLELVDAFERVNPSSLMIKPGRQITDSGDVEGQPDPLATGRLLVCDRRIYVDFFRANDFEMHAACPVVHGSTRPSGRDREIVTRLKPMPQVNVYLVHDLTPNGLVLAERIRDSSHWFAGRENVVIHDLGITRDQHAMLDGQLRPLTSIPHSGDAGMSIMDYLGEFGSELTVFRPQRLLNMTWHSIEQSRPFHEVDPRKARDDGMVGGGG